MGMTFLQVQEELEKESVDFDLKPKGEVLQASGFEKLHYIIWKSQNAQMTSEILKHFEDGRASIEEYLMLFRGMIKTAKAEQRLRKLADKILKKPEE